ncbi:MAG: phosphohistidine phosphatase SixA [Candidatus Eiseniibacteriota bacterium]
MRVVLFRHGPAGEADPARWPNDALRPLSEDGRERTRRAAQGVAELEPTIVRVISSPLLRARESAQLLSEALELEARVTLCDPLAPGGSTGKLLEALPDVREEEAVALVGHEPDLGKLAGTLLFGAPAHVAMKKAGACAIEFGGRPGSGAGQLVWFLPPRMLRRAARGRKVEA